MPWRNNIPSAEKSRLQEDLTLVLLNLAAVGVLQGCEHSKEFQTARNKLIEVMERLGLRVINIIS